MGTTEDPAAATPATTDWSEVQASPDFAELRRRLRGFVFPMAGLFLAWYLLYVLLADYAHGFMSTKLFGNITVGLVFGLLQFVSTFVITGLYVRFANRVVDPAADKIRHEIEGDDQ
ncbi:DUF485 domain-containing protein [Kutzneria buriramensis]|uniref:Uncharacterized membrane protein (DUF485 family) n=1 Tax=Kutzneria buriramensis TaxID=1045776 RepID=A0A3E0HTW9_9PSEU|nr:DUF485 domain-containing protein [Kutzneria buriramensis]REH49894.1 uncharacterized membrane protein (DUF485 family) [Kutzneria buriramensis]